MWHQIVVPDGFPFVVDKTRYLLFLCLLSWQDLSIEIGFGTEAGDRVVDGDKSGTKTGIPGILD